MKAIYRSLLALLTFATATQAEVFIYKGSLRITSEAGAGYPRVANAFLIVEPATQRFATITYFRKGSTKVLLAGGPGVLHVTSANLPAGKTATVMSQATATEISSTSFAHNIVYFRGTNATLKTNTSGIVTQSVFPRLFQGQQLLAQALAGDSIFIEGKFSFLYQQPRSVAANNAALVIDQVNDALIAELHGLGY